MIACHLRYVVNPAKLREFELYSRVWISLVNRFGGRHLGYLMPSEGASNIALATFTFPFRGLRRIPQAGCSRPRLPGGRALCRSGRLHRQLRAHVLPAPHRRLGTQRPAEDAGMTEQLYRADAYLRDCTARVLAVTERGGIVLDRTVFYAAAGGQPGDKGVLEIEGGDTCPIAATVYDTDKATIVHVAPEGGALPSPGQAVRAVLDWNTRSRLMRMHTGLHLLCALVKFPVTGGKVGADEGRLDFDIEDASAVDKDKLTADLSALIAADHPVTERWIGDAELEANPGLVRTMAVKPPMGTGKVRLVVIGENGAVDLQPCGGTHVRTTGEIGLVAVTRIEKKGKLNRRIRVAFA